MKMQLSILLVSSAVLFLCVQLCGCDVSKEQSAVEVTDKETEVLPLHSSTAVVNDVSAHEKQGVSEPELVEVGRKIKKKKPKLKLKKAKKFIKKFLPFLLIPFIIQAKILPLFLFKLKLIALKALGIGKLAILLLIFNFLYNASYKAEDADQQYSQEVLASEHYGYNGGPEYGAWVQH